MKHLSLPFQQFINHKSLRIPASILILGIQLLVCTLLNADEPSSSVNQTKELPHHLAPFFHPPTQYEGKLSPSRSPLQFNDGSQVESAQEWPKRRDEILETWSQAMGEWESLLPSPQVEIVATEKRGNITQQQLRVGIGPNGMMVNAFLLIPKGEGPFPAVLVVYYDAQAGVGLGTPMRDFAWQLANRGFVTLSIGKPNTGVNLEDQKHIPGSRMPWFGAVDQPIKMQPLSMLAYVAANAHTVLAQWPDVDPNRIGIVGHSFGGKWAMFASCLYEKFACGVWSDPGIVFDERDRRKQNPSGSVNYWDDWYLGAELGTIYKETQRYQFRKLPSEGTLLTGAYKQLTDTQHDLIELHALMAPRPFLVSGGTGDRAERWEALNHSIAVNTLLGYHDRVGMTNRETHTPTEKSNEQICRFFEWWLSKK